MRLPSVCLTAKASLDQVGSHLGKHHLSGAPVVDEDHKLIGFVSEYDCLQQLLQSTYYSQNSALVEDVMSTRIISTTPTTTLLDLGAELYQQKLNVIAVTENERVVGVVSRGDVVRALIRSYQPSMA